jgi:hypothetical protein
MVSLFFFQDQSFAGGISDVFTAMIWTDCDENELDAPRMVWMTAGQFQDSWILKR